MEPTDPEWANAVGRIEFLYKGEAVPPRAPRDTHVDVQGYQWVGRYDRLRQGGMPHEPAIQHIEADIRSHWVQSGPTPTPEPTPNPLTGRLRYSVGGPWQDDNGPVAPLFCHDMSSFSQWVHGKRDTVTAQTASQAAAGYQGKRVLFNLGYFDQASGGGPGAWHGKEVTRYAFTSHSGRAIPATPNYDQQFSDYLLMLHANGQRLMLDNGDLNPYTVDQKMEHMRLLGKTVASLGEVGFTTVAGIWACNESWQNGVPDHEEAASMLKSFRDGAQGWWPDTRGLSWGAKENNWDQPQWNADFTVNSGGDPTGELPDSMKWWSIEPATVITMHGARLNWATGEHLIAHYLGYSWYDGNLRSYGKRTWNTEPVGGDKTHGHLVSNGAIHDPERIAGVAIECLLTGQAHTFMSGAGVWGDWPIDEEPGYAAVGRLHQWIPRDIGTFTTIGHASKPEAIIRDDKPGQHHSRADYAIHSDGRFVLHAYGDGSGQNYAMPFARACAECKVIDVVNNRVQADGPRHVGDRFSDPFVWSRLVVGRLA
jgi:hypothetical protein